MSAPPTPQAMAEWLEEAAGHIYCPYSSSDEDVRRRRLRQAAAWLRAQPTEAQKIEALKELAEAAEWGIDCARELTNYHGQHEERDEIEDYHTKLGASKMAEIAWHHARAAMRLLGIDPEAP